MVHDCCRGAAKPAERIVAVQDRYPPAVDIGKDGAVAARHGTGGVALQRRVDSHGFGEHVLARRGGGLMQLGEIFRTLGDSKPSNEPRRFP